ncbi:hypothetical protein [Burkholderia stabilis]
MKSVTVSNAVVSGTDKSGRLSADRRIVPGAASPGVGASVDDSVSATMLAPDSPETGARVVRCARFAGFEFGGDGVAVDRAARVGREHHVVRAGRRERAHARDDPLRGADAVGRRGRGVCLADEIVGCGHRRVERRRPFESGRWLVPQRTLDARKKPVAPRHPWPCAERVGGRSRAHPVQEHRRAGIQRDQAAGRAPVVDRLRNRPHNGRRQCGNGIDVAETDACRVEVDEPGDRVVVDGAVEQRVGQHQHVARRERPVARETHFDSVPLRERAGQPCQVKRARIVVPVHRVTPRRRCNGG